SPIDFQPFATQGRADVWVIDPENIGHPIDVITLFGDSPRALATGQNGSRVYVGIFKSGNQTTLIDQNVVACDIPPPRENVEGITGPCIGLIVKFNGADWLDAAGRSWTPNVRVTLPDWDVFALDAMADPPAEITRVSGVGTILFNMVVNPVNGKLYVSNLESRNDHRFTGPGIISGGETLRGH